MLKKLFKSYVYGYMWFCPHLLKKSSKKKFVEGGDSEFVLLSYIKILQRNFLNASWF